VSDEPQHPAGLYVARQRELVDLVVLGLLSERPRHTYDMHRELRQRGNTSFIRGLPRSLYHGVERNLADGFIEELEVSREGARPERTVYRTTDDGRAELTSRLQFLLGQRSDAGSAYAALSLIGYLTPEQALWSLRSRAAAIAGEAARIQSQIDGLVDRMPRLFLIEVEYLHSQLEAEERWVNSIIADIESGALTWPTDDELESFRVE
jgi:DNA-binding PadR family transcriptional regulator